MLKLIKWVYEMGIKHAMLKVEKDMYLKHGPRPTEPRDLPSTYEYELYKNAMIRWYAVDNYLNDFFGHTPEFNQHQVDELMREFIDEKV